MVPYVAVAWGSAGQLVGGRVEQAAAGGVGGGQRRGRPQPAAEVLVDPRMVEQVEVAEPPSTTTSSSGKARRRSPRARAAALVGVTSRSPTTVRASHELGSRARVTPTAWCRTPSSNGTAVPRSPHGQRSLRSGTSSCTSEPSRRSRTPSLRRSSRSATIRVSGSRSAAQATVALARSRFAPRCGVPSVTTWRSGSIQWWPAIAPTAQALRQTRPPIEWPIRTSSRTPPSAGQAAQRRSSSVASSAPLAGIRRPLL